MLRQGCGVMGGLWRVRSGKDLAGVRLPRGISVYLVEAILSEQTQRTRLKLKTRLKLRQSGRRPVVAANRYGALAPG